MSETHVEVIRRMFDAFNRQDIDGQVEHLSDEYEWHPAFTAGGLVEGSVYRGRDGYRQYLREHAETWARTELEIEEIRDLGDRVLALARIHAIGRTSGVELDQRFGGIWTFRDGKLTEGRAYRASDEALRAVAERAD